jgi:quercetin dioxygenase-like cupin family protein
MILEPFASGSEAPWEEVGSGVRRQILCRRPELMMMRVLFAEGAAGPPHAHPHVQCSYVEEGAFDVTIGGIARRLGRGDSFIVPPDVVHGVVAREAGSLVDVFTPWREDILSSAALARSTQRET